jgi:hypothetical protein
MINAQDRWTRNVEVSPNLAFLHLHHHHRIIHIMASLDLTPAQAKALFDAGGFLIISDLPEGSEFSIDGT